MCMRLSDNWEENLKNFIEGREIIKAFKSISTKKYSGVFNHRWHEGMNYSTYLTTELKQYKKEIEGSI